MIVDEVRRLAATHELVSVDFLVKFGWMGARGEGVCNVRMRFIDGAVVVLTRAQFESLKDVQFKLRPSLDNS
ncbi:MAG: hypothetical protein AB7I42_25770 [Bradyrhizobium sp.]|uniref:hypothetical protein n=1 Tax=Bradyrhizobium sp. TaxID=376 RepID=UPI003D121506